MAAFEKLMLIIDADGKGAIREVNGVARSVDKLSASEKKLDRVAAGMVSIGSAAVAAGAVAAVGLAKAAQAAGALEAAIATSDQVFGDSAAKIREFAEGAADSIGQSERAATEAATTFGRFGKIAGLTGDDLVQFSTSLTTLASDLAAAANTSTADAVLALGSALRGEYDPLEKYGALLSETRLKAEFSAATNQEVTGTLTAQQKILAAYNLILKDTADSQGQFEREQGQLGTSLAQLQAKWEDATAAFGKGVLPFATTALGGITGLIDKFNALPPVVKSGAGTLAAFGVTLTATLGALSVAGGQLLMMRDRFVQVKGTGDEAARSLTGLGKAAAVAGGALTALAAIQIADSIRKGITDQAGEAEDALERFKGSLDGTSEEVLRSFSKLAGSVDDSFFTEIVQVWGKNFKILPDLADETIEDIQSAFEGLTLPEQKQVLDAFREYGKALEVGSQAYQDNVTLLDNLSGRYQQNGKAAEQMAKEQLAASGAVSATAPKFDEATGAILMQGEASEESSMMVKEYASAVDLLQSVLDVSKAAVDGFTTSMEQSVDPLNNQVDLAQKYAGSMEGFKDVASSLPKDLNVLTAATGGYTDEQNKAIDALQEVGEATRSNLAQLIASGQGYDTVRAAASSYEKTMRDQLKQLGITGAAQDEYIKLLGLTPDQVETAIKLSGAEQARATLQLLQTDIDALPEEKRSEVYALIANNQWEDALEVYKQFKNKNVAITTSVFGLAALQTAKTFLDGLRDKTVAVNFRLTGGQTQESLNAQAGRYYASTGAGAQPRDTGANGMIRMAMGGFNPLPSSALIAPGRGRGLVQWAEGETGGEAFIPLAPTKRKRSKDLWWETGRRLGVIQMAQGGFTADTLWGAIAEVQQNRSQFLFETASPAEQWNDLNRRLAQLHQFSDGWMDVQRQIMRMQEETAREQARAAEEALAAQQERADNEWRYTYDKATLDNKMLLAAQRRDNFQVWSDEWTQWQREIDRLTEDAKQQLTPRATASGGRSGGQAPFYLTVNVNAQGLVTDPQEVGRQVVGAIRQYEQANGTTWRA